MPMLKPGKGGEIIERFRVRVAWWLLVMTVCTHFCLAYIHNSQPFLDLAVYMRGGARLPYQHRVLMAWVLRGFERFPFLAPGAARLPMPLHDPLILIVFVASWLSLLGSIVFTWRSLYHLTGHEEYSRWAALLVAYMAYFQFTLVFGLNFLLPYDMPSLLFFCGDLYCVISKRMPLFYPIFVLGTFNRETICMTTIFLVIWRWPLIRQRKQFLTLCGHVLAQAAIWFCIKLYLAHLFAGNEQDSPGATFYYKLAYNLHILVKPQHWPVLASTFGFTLPLVIVWRKWMKNKSMENQVYLVAAWFVVMMFVGVIVEIRIFSELISYMSLALGLILFHRVAKPAWASIKVAS